MTGNTLIENPADFLKGKHNEGCLFILEKYLDALPDDWFDAVTFIFTNGIDQRKDSHLVIMNDDESERFLKITSFAEIPLFIWSDKEIDGKKIIWNVLLTKEYIDGDPDPKKLFIGGENLREYCDKRNIYYKSTLIGDNKLISGTNLKYQKKEGEDCRIPILKEKIQ